MTNGNTQAHLRNAGPLLPSSSTRSAISLGFSLTLVHYLAPQETLDVTVDPLIIFSLFLDPPATPFLKCIVSFCCSFSGERRHEAVHLVSVA